MKRLRLLAVLGLAILTFGFGSCTRTVNQDLGQKGQVVARDASHAFDTFSKYFLNYDADDPYLGDQNFIQRDINNAYDSMSKLFLNHDPDDPTLD